MMMEMRALEDDKPLERWLMIVGRQKPQKEKGMLLLVSVYALTQTPMESGVRQTANGW
jgi:hypothetical protein